jgi:hypothetical protein
VKLLTEKQKQEEIQKLKMKVTQVVDFINFRVCFVLLGYLALVLL